MVLLQPPSVLSLLAGLVSFMACVNDNGSCGITSSLFRNLRIRAFFAPGRHSAKPSFETQTRNVIPRLCAPTNAEYTWSESVVTSETALYLTPNTIGLPSLAGGPKPNMVRTSIALS